MQPDFKTLEASRPPFPADSATGTSKITYTRSPNPAWTPGTPQSPPPTSQPAPKHIAIDPNSPSRTAADNYRLLISGIVPRPIGFVSTVSADGAHRNLAPFSYFQMANHDPPIFTLGFSGANDKDTLANLVATGECTINIISAPWIDAANYCSIDAPPDVDEWALSGLTPAPTDVVAAPRVAESVFAVEARLCFRQEFTSPRTGRRSGTLVGVEGVRFWAREDALVGGVLDLAVLNPISRLGGITYATTSHLFELPRPRFDDERAKDDVRRVLEAETPN